jgi:DNA-binding response OmpR family regulator
VAHILIVEDDQDINDLIARNLTLVGHTFRQVFDGAEAVIVNPYKQLQE